MPLSSTQVAAASFVAACAATALLVLYYRSHTLERETEQEAEPTQPRSSETAPAARNEPVESASTGPTHSPAQSSPTDAAPAQQPSAPRTTEARPVRDTAEDTAEELPDDVPPHKISPVILKQLLSTSTNELVRARALEGAFAQSAFAPLQKAWRGIGGVEVLAASALADNFTLQQRALAADTLANFAHDGEAQEAMERAGLYDRLPVAISAAVERAPTSPAAARFVSGCFRVVMNTAVTDDGAHRLVARHLPLLGSLAAANTNERMRQWKSHAESLFRNLACSAHAVAAAGLPGDGTPDEIALALHELVLKHHSSDA